MDKKISQLTAATTPLTGSELIPVVQSGQTVKATIEDVRGYKVYTALLTQLGGDSPSPLSWDDDPGGPLLTIGVTYEIIDVTGNPDFTNVGAPNNNLGTKFVATGTTANYWGQGVLLWNGGAPVVNVLENTIGNIWWTYVSEGNWMANSDGLFPSGKVYIDCKNIFSGANFVNLWESIETSAVPNQLTIYYADYGGTFQNGMDLGRVEIRVYN